ALEPDHVPAHHLFRSPAITVADGAEELAMLPDRVVESLDAIEREEPDAQRQHVVLLERPREEGVVGAGIDMPVDSLVELDQRPLVVLGRYALELFEELDTALAILRRRMLGGETCPGGLEGEPHLGQAGQIAHIDAGDEDPAAGIDLDELFAGERPQRLA